MKKIVAILLAVLMLTALLSGCSNKDNSPLVLNVYN